MALSDRDIIITPNRGAASEPNILFSGGDALNSGTITLTVLNTGSTAILRWSGSAGNLVSITNTSGTVLNVLSTTQATSTLTGALQVAGGVGIQGNLWVGGTINGSIASAGSATNATNLAGGTANQIPVQTAPNTTGFIVAPTVANTVLTWNGSAFIYALPASTFNGGTITNPLFINNATQTNSTSTGALVVLGGVGIGGGLVVGNITTVTNTTNATNTATGAFQVRGGAAVGLDLQVGGNSFINGNATITGDLAVNGGDITSTTSTFNLLNAGVTTLNLANAGTAITVGATTGFTAIRNLTTITNATNASSTTTGALVVTGGGGIGGNLYVGGNLVVNGTPITPIATTFSEQIATASQTTFTIPGGYTPPFIQVFANGILLSTSNYTASNGTTVVVNNARNAGDVMRFVAGASVLGFTTSTFASNIFGGAANQLLVQTGLNATGFITAPVTSNTVLTWNGSAFIWQAPASASSTMLTVGTATSALFFPAFVDSNNATATAESLFTTSSFTINPSTRAIVAGGQFDSVGATYLGTGVTGDALFVGSAGSRMRVNTGGSGIRIVSEGANPLSLFASTVGIGGLTIADAGGVVTINSNTNATSAATGALRVVGGVGIGGNTWIGGSAIVTGGNIDLRNSTTSSIIMASLQQQGNTTVFEFGRTDVTNTPAIDFHSGGANIDYDVRIQAVGGNTSTIGQGRLDLLANQVYLNSTQSATSTQTGALRVEGGVGIGGNLYVGGTIFQNGVPVGTGAASSAAGVTTVSSATNATRFLTFVDNNHSVASTSSVYTDAGISYNPSTNDLTITGTFIQTPATLGSTLGSTSFYQSLRGSNGNQNFLETFMIRDSGGDTNWTTAGTRIQQKIDATWMAYQQFNGTSVLGGIEWGAGTTTVSPQAIAPRMRLSNAGVLTILTDTIANSTGSGALVVGGGIGANGNIYASGNLFLENANANITLGSAATSSGLKTIILNRVTSGDTAIIRAGNQSYFGGSTNLDILNNTAFTNFDLRSFSSTGWGPTGQGVRIRIEGTQGDVQIFNDTQSTSTSTGALQVRGGLAVGGNIHFGGQLFQNGVLFSGGGGGDPIVFNDISTSFDGLESVFTLKDGFNNTGTVDVYSAGEDWTSVTLPRNGGGGVPPPSTTLLGTTPGVGSFVVPANVTTMVLEAWGGGGGSAGQNRFGTDTAAGGAFAQSVVDVTPGQTVFFSVGAGGTGGATSGSAGTQSWINVGTNAAPTSSTTGVRAAGGAGSGVAFPNNSTQLANSVGTIINIGGPGPRQISEGGGGGAPVALYTFTDATFTPGGHTGNTGPSLTSARNGLTSTGSDAWKTNTAFFNTTNGIQQWTVPVSGLYRIQASGAKGGDEGNAGRGGNGARMQGEFALTSGEIINILVGQQANMSFNGAGGGTFVYRNATDSLPLIAAGGGGGWGSSGGSAQGGTTNANGLTGVGASTAGGQNGQGGSAATNSGWGGAGAGWLSNGQDGGLYGGIAFAPRNGGAGGNVFQCSGGFGGFGGGGGGGCNGGGGGGGFSGGGTSGGGGGSFNNGTNQVNQSGVNSAPGSVVITLLSATGGGGSGGGGGTTFSLTDTGPITGTSATAFSYVTMPGGTRTLLNYITSFGINGNSNNDGGSTWNNAFATLNYAASPITSASYFTQFNRVRVIDGDGSADGPDWAVFNFGITNGSGDYDGTSDTNAFFGGEITASGGRGSSSSTIGRVWGFNTTVGWVLLYQLPLGSGSGSAFNHTNGGWFSSGGPIVTSGNGKRAEYDSASITHIGFSVT